MSRAQQQPAVHVSQETKRVTTVSYSNEGLQLLITQAVLRNCNIEPRDKVRVIVRLSGGDEGCDVTCSVTIEEVID